MHYIGIDLGGTSIKGAVVTEGGTILKEASCPTQRESGPWQTWKRLDLIQYSHTSKAEQVHRAEHKEPLDRVA